MAIDKPVKIGQLAYTLARQLLVKDKGGIASLPSQEQILGKVQDIFQMLKAGGFNPVSAEKSIKNVNDLKKVLTNIEMKQQIEFNLAKNKSEGLETVLEKMDKGIPLNPGDQAKMSGVKKIDDDEVLDAFKGFKPIIIQGGKSEGIEKLLKSGDVKKGVAPKTTKETIERKSMIDPKLTEEENIKNIMTENKAAAKRLEQKMNPEKDLGDRLKDFDGDPDAMAQGGRIGFSGGGAGFAGDPMEGDQYVMGENIPGSPQVPMGQFGPVNVGIFGSGGYSKNQIVPGVDMATTNQNYGITGQIPIGNTGFTIGGDYMKSRANERFTGEAIPGQTFKNVPTDSDRFNVGINFRKQFKDGSKPPNPGRRNFMKMMAGLASLPVVGKLFKGAKVAEKVVQLKNTTTTMPAWFPQFVDKFLSKGIGKKVDADLMEFKNSDLPGVTVTKHDDGRIFVEGKNAYNEPYEIDYTPPGYEVVDEATGKAVKTKGDFQAVDTQYRRTGPEMDDYDVDGVVVNDIDNILGGNATELEGFAKGTGKSKYTKGQKEVDMADAENTRADVNEGPDIDMSDYEDFAKGGLAYMLGE